MDKRRIGIIIVGILVVALMVALLGGPLLGDANNRVTIKGTCYYDIINKWGVTFDGFEVSDDNLMPFYIITGKGEAIIELNGPGSYRTSVDIGDINDIYAKEEFSGDLRWVLPGTYEGKITIEEVKYDWSGIFEQSRVEVASTTFTVVVE